MIPKRYFVGSIEDLKVQDFVVANRDGTEDVGFVAALEWVSQEQLNLRKDITAPLNRKASEAEKDAFFVRKAHERKALTLCKRKAEALQLPMKVSMARIDARNGKYIFHFTSEQRVDFRLLVKELSEELKARIELWQIGVRDEARAIDGFGVCGLQTCCSSWLTEFRPINIRMAKTQDINLPPAKLSGQCGRLLCCLSYEVDQYKEMGRQMLPKGATIKVEGRDGVIIDRNLLLQTYTIQFAEGGSSVLKAEDIGEVRIPEQMKRMAEVFDRQGTEDSEEDEPVLPEPQPKSKPQAAAAAAQRPQREKESGAAQASKRERIAAPPVVSASDKPEVDKAEGDESSSEEQGRSRGRGRRRSRNRSMEAVSGTAEPREAASPAPERSKPREERRQNRKPAEQGAAPVEKKAEDGTGVDGEARKARRHRRRGARNRGTGGDAAPQGPSEPGGSD
ncbi:MAG: regulatory iron-sulfur-containing complex subunit RicT [Candidatus Sumerlaeia bacterium]|nr:regulatory iron-sulfur-containing complex subunit RicT [Candidatus Sumerlaeia bacterium]